MTQPTRKTIRLKEYCYCQNGAYFITICTHHRACILGEIVGTTIGRPCVRLSQYGKIVETGIQNISLHYQSVKCVKYVIMPNHVHLILHVQNEDQDGRPMVVPTLATVVNQMKGYVSKQIGSSIWQARFYDHIIRNEKSYQEIWHYIDTNPFVWELDRYYQHSLK